MSDWDEIRAALYCAAEVIRHRQRVGQPVPQWLSRHLARLDAEVRVSRSGLEFDSSSEQLGQDELMTAQEVSQMLECSKRHVQRLASDLDGQMIGGRWLFRRSVVTDYAEGRRQDAI